MWKQRTVMIIAIINTNTNTNTNNFIQFLHNKHIYGLHIIE